MPPAIGSSSFQALAAGTTFLLAGMPCGAEGPGIACPTGAARVARESDQGSAEWCELPDGVRHGPFVSRHLNGGPMAKGSFQDGRVDGLWKRWDQAGQRRDLQEWHEGRLAGAWTSWEEGRDGTVLDRYLPPPPEAITCQGSALPDFPCEPRRNLPRIEISRAAPPDGGVKGLDLPSHLPLIQLLPDRASARELVPVVVVETRFQPVAGGLVTGPELLLCRKGETCRFAVELPPQGKPPVGAELVALSASGGIERESIVVGDLRRSIAEPVPEPLAAGSDRLWLLAGLELDSHDYRESGLRDLALSTIEARLAIDAPLRAPSWRLRADFRATLGAVYSSTGAKPTFLGADARAGYRLAWVREPWSAELWLGGYYRTMLSPSGELGYNNISGPRLYPSLSRWVGPCDRLEGHLRISPVLFGTTIAPWSNHELGGAATWDHFTAGGRRLSAWIEASELKLSFSRVSFLSQAVALGLALGF